MVIVDAELYMAFTSLKNYKTFLKSVDTEDSVNKIRKFTDCEKESGTIHLVKSIKDFEKNYGKIRGVNPKSYDDACDILGIG